MTRLIDVCLFVLKHFVLTMLTFKYFFDAFCGFVWSNSKLMEDEKESKTVYLLFCVSKKKKYEYKTISLSGESHVCVNKTQQKLEEVQWEQVKQGIHDVRKFSDWESTVLNLRNWMIWKTLNILHLDKWHLSAVDEWQCVQCFKSAHYWHLVLKIFDVFDWCGLEVDILAEIFFISIKAYLWHVYEAIMTWLFQRWKWDSLK